MHGLLLACMTVTTALLLCLTVPRGQGWNNVTIELWTHARDGLSENDFIVAAKLDELLASPDVQQLLSKKQPVL